MNSGISFMVSDRVATVEVSQGPKGGPTPHHDWDKASSASSGGGCPMTPAGED